MAIQHPNTLGIEYELDAYQTWYVEFLAKTYDLLKSSGADDINVAMDVFYSNQCNFEIFNRGLLKNMSNFDVSIPVSVYCLTNKKLREFLEVEGYSECQIGEIFGEEN